MSTYPMNMLSSPSASTWGRIARLTKISFYSTLRSLLIFYGAITLAFLGLPFIFYLFDKGNPLTALQELVILYSGGALVFLYGLSTLAYLTYWLHQVIYQPTPGAYTQIPASTGEKLISLGILHVAYFGIAQVVTSLVTLLFALLTGQSLRWTILWEFFHPSIDQLKVLPLILLFGLGGILFSAIFIVHFRKFILGLVAVYIAEFLLGNVLFLISTVFIARYDLLEYLASLDGNLTLLLSTFGLLVIDIALAFALHWRLKTLQLK